MKYRLTVLMVALIVFGVAGCYYDKESILYPSATICDTSTASTYSGKVAPIMSTYCNSCHAASVADGGVVLDSYTSIKTYVTNGKLLSSINHSSGVSAMPKGAGKLPDCIITQVTRWVNAGALNN